jgi:transcriptional regulator with XRE-family HTH domain
MGLKTHEMAEKLGTSSSVISGIENAKRTPSKNILMALYALDEDVDMDWLILGTSRWSGLRKDFTMREAENKALQQRNMEKEEENLKLLAKIHALQSGTDEEITGLNQSILLLRNTLSRQDIRIEKDRKEIAELNKKIQDQSREMARLKQENEAKDAKIKELIKELAAEQALKPSALLVSEHEHADSANEKTQNADESPSAKPTGGTKHGGLYKTKTHIETSRV